MTPVFLLQWNHASQHISKSTKNQQLDESRTRIYGQNGSYETLYYVILYMAMREFIDNKKDP